MFSPTRLSFLLHGFKLKDVTDRRREKQQVSNEKDRMSWWKTTRSKKQSFWYLRLLHASTSVFNMSLVLSKLWAPKECLKSQFPCSSFFPLFNFGILWSTALVILVLFTCWKHYSICCRVCSLWNGLLKRMKPQMSLRTSNTEKLKGTRVLRIVGNEMIGRPWTEATAEMSLGIRATPTITDHSAIFSYRYQN